MSYKERSGESNTFSRLSAGIERDCNDATNGDCVRSLVHQFLFVFRSEVCRYDDMAFFCSLPTVRDAPLARPDLLMDYLVECCGWVEVVGWGSMFNRRTIRRPSA